MRSAIADVAAFHAACDIPILATPQCPANDRRDLRIRLIDEEVNEELLPAMAAGDLVDIADGLADAIYVLAGAALEYGIPLERVWDAVQAANMAKVDPVSGKVARRSDGKILKPPGWSAPDIAAILAV